ncbi:hypothetical protein [Brucella gallinifaecis]|uniref:hypothetical protein n=1 Tax=Brucella gallinifaecis TaxID=215590 RepID=UPI0023627282|nr:hypothetical protein [Brucella gallinifaecis]
MTKVTETDQSATQRNRGVSSPWRRISQQALSLGIAAIALSACVTIDPIQPSAAGYDAIEFTRVTVVQDHAWNKYVFAAGRRYIGDRRDAKGRTLYCGLVTVNATDAHPFDACFGFIAPNTIIIAPNYGFKEVERPLPAGAVRMIKVKP